MRLEFGIRAQCHSRFETRGLDIQGRLDDLYEKRRRDLPEIPRRPHVGGVRQGHSLVDGTAGVIAY